ncbi:MAG: UDP-glucose/iron transport system permease protein, partial [Actinomycetota bacterium]|nr:UDP-glucose/iron transport system permease protein [Actinomycetota bacterium]
MTNDIGWSGLAASVVLVAVAVALSFARRLSLERSIVWASARALVQLLLVGVALDFVLRRGLAWSWAWIIAML